MYTEINNFLNGYKDAEGVLHTEFEFREMNGADEEAIAKHKVKENSAIVTRVLLERCIERIGTIEKAKVKYISMVEEMYDYPSQIISYYYASEILNSDLPEERKKMVDKVTKEDIISVSKKVHIDTIYLLGGEDNE